MDAFSVVLPAVVDPSAVEIQESLKIIISAVVGKANFVIIDNAPQAPRLPAVLSPNRRVLFDGNAVARLFCFTPDESEFQAFEITSWLNRESRSFSLQYLEENVDELYRSPLCVQICIFSRLYAMNCSYNDQLREWFDNQANNFEHAISTYKNHYSACQTRKISPSVVLPNIDRSNRTEILPDPSKRNILITSALPYVNNVPHLGNIIGCVLSADVFARYCRLREYNTLYICGTDEYGTATETKAIEEGLSCQELCDKYHKIHARVYEWFGIDFDHFGRTTTPQHTKISQKIFKNLNDKDLFVTKSIEQLYCESCLRFLADRFVEGTCPHCMYLDARGDQCDGCGKLINAVELVNPRCKLDSSTPILKSSKHMFLELPRLQAKCENFFQRSSSKGNWSANGISITKAWLKEGLEERCSTRVLKWGTPVPLENMEGKVLYVWFDAPIGYLSITANYTDRWEEWWKNPENVQLYQFMGKDNVPFHTVVFPCTLLGTEDNYTLLHHLSTTEYLNYEGDKFSKSRGIGVFGNNVMESDIPVSVWRYYLMSIRPETADSMFTWTDLGMRTNGELLTNLGNFINRTLKFLKAKYNSVMPNFEVSDESVKEFVGDVDRMLVQYSELMEAVKLRSALKTAMEISMRANLFLQESKLDNTLFEKQPKHCAAVVAVACNVIYALASLLYPFIPETSENVCKQLNAPLRGIPERVSMDLLAGHRMGNPDHLFKRLEEKKVQELFMKYGGDEILARRNKASKK